MLSISGNFSADFSLIWDPLDTNIAASYILEEAIEDGAYGIAILAIRELTPFKVIKQSFRGSGFDYWLGKHDDSPPFQEKARLEVSGILKGTKGQINQRLKEKLNQTQKSDNFNLPVFVIIVELSKPQIKIKQR